MRRLSVAVRVTCVAAFLTIAAGCTTTSPDLSTNETASSPTPAPAKPTTGTTAAAVTATPGSTVSPTQAAGPALAAGDHTFVLDHHGRRRSYIVHIPEQLEAAAPAVLIALHGGGGTGAAFQEQNGIDPLADSEGFIAVYPEGTGVLPNRLHTWNSGLTCCGYALDNDVDDVDFLREVLLHLAERQPIDAGRVYMTGHSNGAMMAYRFAAEAPELVTAIAPVGGAIDVEIGQIDPPVALLHIHSIDDPRAIYEGGEGPPFPGTERTVHHEPVLPGIDAWATASGCQSAVPSDGTIEGSGENAGHAVEHFDWPNCDGPIAVEHLLLRGSGHGWPGVEVGALVQRHLGPPTTIVHASDEIWAFVSQFDRS